MTTEAILHEIMGSEYRDLMDIRVGKNSVVLQTHEPHLLSKVGNQLRRVGMRVASLDQRTIRASEDSEGAEAHADLKAKLKKWRKHKEDHATEGGYRKAHNKVDPRDFAKQMASLAMQAASKHGSTALKSLGRSLLRASRAKNPRMAELILSELSQERRGDFSPVIQKPAGSIPTLETDTPDFEEAYEPSTTTNPTSLGDQSWSSERASRSAGQNYELVGLATDFIQDYMGSNGLDEDNLDQLKDPSVLEAWLVDLETKGQPTDPAEAQQAWDNAMQTLNGGSNSEDPLYMGQDNGGLDSVMGSIRACGERSEDKSFHNPDVPQMAPGGDFFNQIVDNTSDTPALGSKKASKENIADAVDQCLDHFSGEMLPGEISLADTKNFLAEEFPNVNAKDVYKIINKLAEPRHRHDEEDDDEEDDSKKSSRRRIVRDRAPKEHPMDGFLRSNKTACHGEVACKACQGQGATKAGVCTTCAGKGRSSREISFKNPESGLKVAIDLRRAADRLLMVKYTGSRIASNSLVMQHSTNLMRYLVRKNIPFATTEFKHPMFRIARRARLDWKPVNWNIFENVPWEKLPWSIKAGVQALGLGRKLDQMTLRKFAAALQTGNPILQQKTGRNAQEIIQELNDFVMNEGRAGNRVAKKELTAEFLKRKKTERSKKRAQLLLSIEK